MQAIVIDPQSPQRVGFRTVAQAAALPMAGLTALAAIERGCSLLARPVLVTGASGGVGLLACQLASLAGARVVGQVRHRQSASLVHDAGADHVIADEDVAAAVPFGPYHLIVEQLGGEALAEAMTQLAPAGTCISVGVSIGPAGYVVPVDMARMRRAPGANLHILNVYQEFRRESASVRLHRLVRLVGDGKLTPISEPKRIGMRSSRSPARSSTASSQAKLYCTCQRKPDPLVSRAPQKPGKIRARHAARA